MTKIGLAGDWHGNSRHARASIAALGEAGVAVAFQLGDFGLGWPGKGEEFLMYVRSACAKAKLTLYIVPGNHENWDWIDAQRFENGLAKLSRWVYVVDRTHRMDVGGRSVQVLSGAPSIDFQGRIEKRDWWKQEMPTLAQVEKVAASGHADIMLAHDAPSDSTLEVQRIITSNPLGWGPNALRYAHGGRMLMDLAFAGVKPKVFAHGHYHVAGIRETDETLFVSVDCDGTRRSQGLLDLDTLQFEWLELQ